MDFLPKNDGSFAREMKKMKEEFLERKKEQRNTVELEKVFDEKIQKKIKKIKKMVMTSKGREKLKREFCALEAKSVQMKLEGKEQEYKELSKKIAIYKAIFIEACACFKDEKK